MQYNNREVTTAVLHEVVHIGTIGQIGPTLDTVNPNSKLKGLKMKIVDDCVVVDLQNRTYLIPKTSFKIIALAPEAKVSTTGAHVSAPNGGGAGLASNNFKDGGYSGAIKGNPTT